MKKLRLTTRQYWLAVAALTALRGGITVFQRAYTWVGGAPLDDELMFRAAQAVTGGEWLGAYDYLTLSKSMFFPVWLAFLHALHLPYLLGGVLLWCGAALLTASAFAPLLKNRARQLALYAALAFLPSSWAAYTLRVYRDNIFPALCLFFFAGMAGAMLRPERRQWPWLTAAGLGLAAAYLSREDAGLFLLPFAGVASVILLVVLAKRRRWLAMAAQGIPYALLAAGILCFCALNRQWYGYWGLSDFSSGSFSDAMGAMSRVATDSEDLMLSVPADARALLYEAVPELEPLRKWLEEDEQLQNDFRNPLKDDYGAGSFYWAIRRAAQYEGIYATAQTADRYWAAVADKVNAACDSGALPARWGRRSSTTQPVRAAYVAPTLAETFRGLGHVLLFQDCRPYETLRSIGTAEDIALWSGYLHQNFNEAAQTGKDTPYYSPYQKAVFAVLAAVRWLFAALLVIGFVRALLCQFAALPRVLKSRDAGRIVPWLLLFGLLGIALLRCAMIAFVEVSSFGIGTSTMYLATVHPLLMIYAMVGGWMQKKEGAV